MIQPIVLSLIFSPSWSGQVRGCSDSPPASILVDGCSRDRRPQSLHQYHGSLLGLHTSRPGSVRKSPLLGTPSTNGRRAQVSKLSGLLYFGDKSERPFLGGPRSALMAVASVMCSPAGFPLPHPMFPLLHTYSGNALLVIHLRSSRAHRHYFQGNQTTQCGSALTLKK